MIVNGFWFYGSNSSYQLSGPIPASPQSLRPWTLIERLVSSAALECERPWGLKVVKRGNALWHITITWRHRDMAKLKNIFVFWSLCRTSFSFLSFFLLAESLRHWTSSSSLLSEPRQIVLWIVWTKHFSALIQLIHVAEMTPTCTKSAKSQSSVKCADVSVGAALRSPPDWAPSTLKSVGLRGWTLGLEH